MKTINLDPIFKAFPDLSPLGFCGGYRFAPWQFSEEKIQDLIQRGQAFLRSPAGLYQILSVMRLLQGVQKTQTGRIDSYYLKNEMERLTGGPGTISNGGLICGAVLLGIGIIRDSMNGLLFLDLRSLRKKGLINA